MKYFIDVAFDSINKYGEELCGDKVEIIRTEEGVIVVVADGLGSGVKANILSTLTSKIAATMLKEGVSLNETVDTIMHTLPVCSVRKLAYSTFTIIKICNSGQVYTAEYDNPPLILIRDNKYLPVEKRNSKMNDRIIKESNFMLKPGDVLTVVSDGAIHAGVGAVLNLGWQWENVVDHLCCVVKKEKCANNISKSLIEVCKNLYENKPGDDTTVVTIKMRHPEVVDLFTGPPQDPEDDPWVVRKLMKGGDGKKIVCGGTAAKIVARELEEEIITSMDFIDPCVPPIAYIKGIDLVTEGVLTLSKAVERMKSYMNLSSEKNTVYDLKNKDGASLLARMLIEDCTHLNLWVGKAVNPAHQNPNLPMDLSVKLKVVDELVQLMKRLGKQVKITYI